MASTENKKRATYLIRIVLTMLFLLPFSAFLMDSWERDVEKSPSGLFDFYVYAITWQPSFCVINNIQNCSNAFKLHGIWPYFKTPTTSTIKNYHPSFCLLSPGCSSFEACEITDKTISIIQADPWLKSILPENPQRLLAHEWSKHGTCSGLNQQDYFFLAKDFNKNINFNNLEELIKERKGNILTRKEIMATLPESTSLWCKQHDGKDFLYEVHFFLDKSGKQFLDTDTQIGNPCPVRFFAPLIDYNDI